MLKIKFILSTLLILSFAAGGTVLANPEDPQVEVDSPPYLSYLPIIFTPPPPAPPDYYSTTWYITPKLAEGSNLFLKGFEAGQITLPPGKQDQLLILDFGQPWGEENQYGTILLRETGIHLTSTNDILYYAKQFITGYMAGSDGESRLELGIGTTNFNKGYYLYRVCARYFCGTDEPYRHGRAWAFMVSELYNWVIDEGYAGQVSIAGAIDIELSWNSPEVSHAWARGFNDHNQGVYIYYNFGTCEGCDIGINLSRPPDPDKDLTGDWTPRLAHYTAWGNPSAWPIPEIYDNNGYLANQWANLSKVGVDLGYPRMYFLSALSQMQACDGSSDPSCPKLDNTPQEAWYQLLTAINKRPETSQYTIPYMTDIDWP